MEHNEAISRDLHESGYGCVFSFNLSGGDLDWYPSREESERMKKELQDAIHTIPGASSIREYYSVTIEDMFGGIGTVLHVYFCKEVDIPLSEFVASVMNASHKTKPHRVLLENHFVYEGPKMEEERIRDIIRYMQDRERSF